MNIEISVHDNFLVSYEVQCEQREIRLITEFRQKGRTERTDLIFRGVEAYHFVGDNFETVVSDVAEVSAGEILEEDSERFEEGREFCWPGVWNASDESVRKHLAERGVRGFVLSSSFGMCGWVLARSMEKISLGGPNA